MVKINSQNISRGYSRASFFKDEDVSELNLLFRMINLFLL